MRVLVPINFVIQAKNTKVDPIDFPIFADVFKEKKEAQIQTLNSLHLAQQDSLNIQLDTLKKVAITIENVFECLMEAAKSCSLGQLTQSLEEEGGKYRQNM